MEDRRPTSSKKNKMNKFLVAGLGLLLSATGASAKTSVYFSPNGGCEEHVVQTINETQKTFEVAMYSLDNSAIISALEEALDRGVKITLVLDRTQAFNNIPETLELRDRGISIRIHSQNKIQHNKFAISDGKKVITGSFNWTKNGERFNEENCLFLDEPEAVKSFIDRFRNHLLKVNGEIKSQDYLNRMEKKSL